MGSRKRTKQLKTNSILAFFKFDFILVSHLICIYFWITSKCLAQKLMIGIITLEHIFLDLCVIGNDSKKNCEVKDVIQYRL